VFILVFLCSLITTFFLITNISLICTQHQLITKNDRHTTQYVIFHNVSTSNSQKLCKILTKWRRDVKPLLLWDLSSRALFRSEFDCLLICDITNLTELSHKHNLPSFPYPIVPSISFHGFKILVEAFSMLFTHIIPIWFIELSCKHKKHTFTHMLHPVASTSQ